MNRYQRCIVEREELIRLEGDTSTMQNVCIKHLARLAAPLLGALIALAAPMPAHAQTYWSDNFDSYSTGTWTAGSTYGAYTLEWNGYGSAGIEADSTRTGHNAMFEKPEASTSSSETHSALILRSGTMGALNIIGWIDNISQLRTGSSPNPWEVGWVLWHYTDNTHFYSFTLQTNGWVLAKEDPNYTGDQRFLASGSTPYATIGTAYYYQITQDSGGNIQVWVNGSEVVSFTDTERVYTSGQYGLYCEDSYVHFFGNYGDYY
jgi:hypothetical protein